MNSGKILLNFIFFSLILGSTAAQDIKINPNDTLVSPRVHSDKTVTFSIYAPSAKEVTVSGDWKTSWGADKLVKDSLGVWSFTSNPLFPDFYSYFLMVDGVKTFDPKNTEFKPGIWGLDNMFVVPGSENEFQENNNVPHGEVRTVWYYSKSLEKQRRMQIYTPAGYDLKKDNYPVLYLQHGAGDDDLGWNSIGRAGFILDNLIASGKAKPMIVVMADGSRTRKGRFQPGQSFLTIMEGDKFGEDFHNDIIPFVEKNYKVIANRENRAFAGLSMGGAQVLWFGLPNYDKFAYLGIFSMGISPDITNGYLQVAESFFKNPEKTNKEIKLLWAASGKNDFLIQGVHNMVKVFEENKIKFTYKETEGGHTWINWRKYLYEFAQLLFK